MASSVPEEKKVKRIVKVLKQIAENLNQDEIISLRTSIRSAIKLTRNHDESKGRTLLEMCVKTLFSRPGISGNLIKQSMRSFLMILKNEQLGNIVIERFTDYILREHSSIAIGMEWDDDLLKAFFKALERGHESAQHARFMVVGMFKAGKTMLVSKLLGRPEPPPNSSTVFIDISVDTCEIDGDGKWKEMTFEERKKRYRVRLHEMFESNKKQDVTTSDRSGSGIPDQVDQGVHMEGETLNKDEKNMSMLKKELNKATSDNTPNPSGYYKDIEEAKDNADLEKRPTVAIWDFAGHSVYYSTHQFFLNPRTIYLLVLDLSKDLNEKVDEGRDAKGLKNLYIGNNQATHFTQLDAFQFWMRSIYVYTKQKDTQNKYTPTIVLVGTHKDACDGDGENTDAFAEKYFKNALKPFANSTLMDLIYKKKFFVSKHESADVFDSLRAELNTIATKQPFWKEPIPAKFIPLEREIEKKISNGAEILQFNELETASEDSHYQLTYEEIQVFLGFQHAFGNILYYQKANPDTIILHPKWIINALKMFVTHRDDLRSEEWTLFTKMGILSETLIEKLLQAEDATWVPFKEKIICYMEHLDIIAKPVKETKETEETQEQQDTNVWHVKINPSKDMTQDFYLMPLRFPSRPSKEEIKGMLGCTKRNKWKSSPVLCMYIKDVFLPPFVFHRILATCIKDMPVGEHKGEHVLSNGFGAFHIDASTILTTWSWDDMIYAKVTSYNVERKPGMDEADLQYVRLYFEKLVRRAFDTDVAGLGEKIEISYYVTCPSCPEHFPFDKETDKEGFPIDQKIGLLLVENLLIVDEVLCSLNNHYVNPNDALKNWFWDDPKTKNVDPCLIKSVPDQRFLADLSEEIDSNKHSELARQLAISPKSLDRIEKDHNMCMLNVTFHILYKWSITNESLAILLRAVKAAGCKEEDFKRILTDKEQTKTRWNNITQKLSPKKLEEIDLGQEECEIIANSIGVEYWLLGIRLGIPEVVIQRINIDNEHKTKIVALNILLEWRKHQNKQTNREINEELITAMLKSHSDMNGVKKIFGNDCHMNK